MSLKKTDETQAAIRYAAVAIGCSAGGNEALAALLSGLPGDLPVPLVVVQHVHVSQDDGFIDWYQRATKLVVAVARDKQVALPGCAYFAPPDYHLLVERDGTLALSVDAKVNWSRPSIDVLFESAADAWASRLVGVILTGASSDGAEGLTRIKAMGGLTIAQDPGTAAYPLMPQAAIDAGAVSEVLAVEEISARILGAMGMKQ